MADLHLPRPPADWQADYAQARSQHMASLPFAYFERGRDRLKSEQGWARGLVTREKKAPATLSPKAIDTNPKR